MRRQSDLERELSARLRDASLDGEDEARERTWQTVRAAREDAPPRPVARHRRGIAIGAAAAAAIALVALTPAGADIREWMGDAIDPESTKPRPALTALPGGGTVLAESRAGVSLVAGDGSRRFLGHFDEPSLSPRALNVAAADGRVISAVSAMGEPAWQRTGKAPVSDIAWSQDEGFRVAYRSGDSLRVAVGDGSGDWPLADSSKDVAPAWRGETDRALGYVDGDGAVRIVDVDLESTLSSFTPRSEPNTIAFSDDGERLLLAGDHEVVISAPDGGGAKRELVPGQIVAASFLEERGDRAVIVTRESAKDFKGRPGSAVHIVSERGGTLDAREIFATAGSLAGLAVSPGGDWILVGWREADQWLFLEPRIGGSVRAVDGISSQFTPGEPRPPFPAPLEWCCR
jgi:hypothetical protein